MRGDDAGVTRGVGLALPSETMVAVTPKLPLLMVSRMPCRELLVLSITIEPDSWFASCSKPAPRPSARQLCPPYRGC